MKLSELKKIIKNGGATLNSDGKIVNFDRGYQVSKKDCYTLTIKNVTKILKAVNSLLNTVKPSEFVGLWIDSGKAYIDISERVPRLYDAMRLGIERKQKSIFDWCTRFCFDCEV